MLPEFFRVCDFTMQGDKRKQAVKVLELRGFDIRMEEVRRSPRWKDDLTASLPREAGMQTRTLPLNHPTAPSTCSCGSPS